MTKERRKEIEAELQSLHDAPTSGPRHDDWIDKPHRIVYDAVKIACEALAEIDRLQELITRLRLALRESHSDHDDYEDWTGCPWCKLLREADEVIRG